MAALLVLPLILQAVTVGARVGRSPLEGVEKCQQGPEFWCKSKETASLCMKEDYCTSLGQNSPAEPIAFSERRNIGRMVSPSETKSRRKRNEGENQKDNTDELERRHFNKKCHVCETIMQIVEQSLSANQLIDTALDSVCGTFLTFLRGDCQSVLDLYKLQIKKAAKKHDKLSDLCQNIGLCSRAAGPYTEKKVDILRLPDPCLRESEDWCESSKTAALYKKEVYCLQLQLNEVVELLSFGQEVKENSSQEKNSSEEKNYSEEKNSSEEKGDKKRKSRRRNKNKKKKKGRKWRRNTKKIRMWCFACTKIMGNLETSAGEDPDEDAIDQALDSMCNNLHSLVARICKTMLEANRDALKEAVKNKADPKELCTQIQMCAGEPGMPIHGPTLPDLTVCRTCTMCQAFTSLVKPLFSKEASEKEIGQQMAECCSEDFGNSTGCKDFVTTYGVKLKPVLQRSWDHITTCLAVGACDSEAVANATSDLADPQCKDGPESWCQSIESALHCKTLPYCVKAWNI